MAHREYGLGQVLDRFSRKGLWNQLCCTRCTDRGRRANAVDCDVGVEQFGGHTLGKTMQGGLAGRIDDVPGGLVVLTVGPHWGDTGDRADVDDPPGTLFTHVRYRS